MPPLRVFPRKRGGRRDRVGPLNEAGCTRRAGTKWRTRASARVAARRSGPRRGVPTATREGKATKRFHRAIARWPTRGNPRERVSGRCPKGRDAKRLDSRARGEEDRRSARTPKGGSGIAQKRSYEFDGVGAQDFEDMNQLDDIHTAFSTLAFRNKRLRSAEPPGEFVLAQARSLARRGQRLSQSQIRFGVCGFSHARQGSWRLRS